MLNAKTKRFAIFFASIFLLVSLACGGTVVESQSPDQIAEVPFGEPDFPNLGQYWVIDEANVLNDSTEQSVDQLLENVREQGYANQAIVVMSGVDDPANYIVQLARHLKLGEAEGENKDNGLLWLVLTDKPLGERVWYAVGNGLPEFTSFEAGEVVDAANPLADQGLWGQAVETIASQSNQTLEETYGQQIPPVNGEEEQSPEEEGEEEIDPATVKIILIIIAIWVLIGVGLMFIDPELGIEWLLLGVRILALGAGSSGSGRSGGGSGRFSRSGR